MSGRKRFFVEQISGGEVTLCGDEFTHARTVQRVEEGTEIILLDGSGKEYTAIVSKVEKKSLSAHIISESVSDKDPKTRIYLLCGLLKGDKTELVVQKATELGVSGIGVFNSEYCAAYTNDNKIERLNKVAREAAKQCMRATVPKIEYFKDFASALDSAGHYENKLFACEFANGSEKDLSTLQGSTAVVVGSEGGFSEREAQFAKEQGFLNISLGKRILRAETAAIGVLAVIAFALGELK